MDHRAWQRKRGELMEVEKRERSVDISSARPNIQLAITEQAIRELYDRVEALENKDFGPAWDAAVRDARRERKAEGKNK